MKYSLNAWITGHIYHSACKPFLKEKSVTGKTLWKIVKEHKAITLRAKSIGAKNMTGAYVMGIYFVALNRSTVLSAEENYEVFKKAIQNSKIIKMSLGDADSYLDEKRLPGRLEWAEESHKKRFENDWVLDVLPGNEEYDLGYDYHECGIVKLCKDEGCPELAKYLCRLDFLLADIMGMELKRTGTLAEGYECCDFRYSRRAK